MHPGALGHVSNSSVLRTGGSEEIMLVPIPQRVRHNAAIEQPGLASLSTTNIAAIDQMAVAKA